MLCLSASSLGAVVLRNITVLEIATLMPEGGTEFKENMERFQ